MLIIGAKGHAVEVLQCMSAAVRERLVFFDNVSINQPDYVLGQYPLLRTVAEAQNYLSNTDSSFILGLGGPCLRRRLAAQFQGLGGLLTTMIAQTAVIGPHTEKLCAGLNIMHHTLIAPGAYVGEGVLLNAGAAIHHDAYVGAYCEISPGARILGRSKLGHSCQVGAQAVVLPDIVVGDEAIIGAGAVVTRNVPAGVTVVGVPARQIRDHK